jgi:hypothetical protein
MDRINSGAVIFYLTGVLNVTLQSNVRKNSSIICGPPFSFGSIINDVKSEISVILTTAVMSKLLLRISVSGPYSSTVSAYVRTCYGKKLTPKVKRDAAEAFRRNSVRSTSPSFSHFFIDAIHYSS